VILIFGKVPSPVPQFQVVGSTLAIKTKEKYVGVHFRADQPNIFAHHYQEKVSTACYCAQWIMGPEDSAGHLAPKEYKQLYMARVDCHLIDCKDIHVKQLCDIQVSFLHQILNLHSHSIILPLFTETGITPLRFRCYLVLLSYLQYLFSFGPTHFARASLDSSVRLA
jgi:hypothetical protein